MDRLKEDYRGGPAWDGIMRLSARVSGHTNLAASERNACTLSGPGINSIRFNWNRWHVCDRPTVLTGSEYYIAGPEAALNRRMRNALGLVGLDIHLVHLVAVGPWRSLKANPL